MSSSILKSLSAITLASLSCLSSAETLRILNWGDYVDPDVITSFERAHSVTVEYVEFNNTDEFSDLFFAKENQFDVIFPASDIVPVLKENQLIKKLNKNNLNHLSNMNDTVMSGLSSRDKNSEYTIPYLWGTTGIGFNVKTLAKLGIKEDNVSWSIIFDEAKRKKIAQCGIGVVNERDEIFSAALSYLGHSINTANKDHLKEAGRLIKEAYADFTYLHTSQYTDDLKDNKICVGIGYSGDILAQTEENDDIRYVIPNEGATLWVDVMAIPTNSPNPSMAYKFINYLMSPEVSAKNSNYAAYPSPMLDAKPFVEPEILADPTIYPDSSTLAALEMIAPVERKVRRIKHRLWVQAICSKGKWCAVPMNTYF